jgi:hypothetical protein
VEVELREQLTDPFMEYSLKSWHQRLRGSWSVERGIDAMSRP